MVESYEADWLLLLHRFRCKSLICHLSLIRNFTHRLRFYKGRIPRRDRLLFRLGEVSLLKLLKMSLNHFLLPLRILNLLIRPENINNRSDSVFIE